MGIASSLDGLPYKKRFLKRNYLIIYTYYSLTSTVRSTPRPPLLIFLRNYSGCKGLSICFVVDKLLSSWYMIQKVMKTLPFIHDNKTGSRKLNTLRWRYFNKLMRSFSMVYKLYHRGKHFFDPSQSRLSRGSKLYNWMSRICWYDHFQWFTHLYCRGLSIHSFIQVYKI